MKKILFLMLSLAVSATAFAGIQQTEKLTKTTPVELTKKVSKTAVKLNAANPFVQAQKKGIATVDRADMKAQTKLRAVVTDQPSGEVKYYKRTAGSSIFRYYDPTDEEDPWGSVAYAEQEGLVMAVQDGNTIWFKNLLFDPDGYFDDYWIQGSVSGTRVTINTGQHVMYSSYYDAYIAIAMGTLTYSNGFSFSKNNNSIRFNISGDKLTLANSSYNGNYGGTCLGTYWTDDNTWGAFADFETVMEIDNTIPEAPTMYTDDDIDAMNGDLVEYNRTGQCFYTTNGSNIYFGTQRGTGYIFYDADGSTVYMRDPVYGWDQGIWVKGTISGNKITVPLGQYLAWTSTFIGLKTAWGEATLTTTEEGSYVSFAVDETVTECTYTIENGAITLDGTSEYVGLATIMDSAYVDIEDGWYPNLDYSTIYYAYPPVPESVNVTPAATTAEVTWTDPENNAWNLRYRVYDPAGDAYFNDFNDVDADDYLDDWYIVDADGDGYNWGIIIMDQAAGDYALYSASYDNDTYTALTPDNWLVSAAIPLNGAVSFKAFGVDANYCAEHFQVYLYPQADAEWESTEDFIAISDEIVADADREHVYTFEIPAEYQGVTGRIAIRHFNITDMFLLVVEDFYVGDPNHTPAPWTVVEDVTSPYTIEGLNPLTTYEVQVQGVNTGGGGMWTESAVFTTLEEPQGLRGDVDDNGTVNISDVTALINHLLSQQWDNVPGEFNYDNADCDLSGSVTIGDVTALINYLLSKKW